MSVMVDHACVRYGNRQRRRPHGRLLMEEDLLHHAQKCRKSRIPADSGKNAVI